MYQTYKSELYLMGKTKSEELYDALITVDQHDIKIFEHSFTFLHWSIMEQLAHKKISVDEISDEVLQMLIYNIIPGGNTILHKLQGSPLEI